MPIASVGSGPLDLDSAAVRQRSPRPRPSSRSIPRSSAASVSARYISPVSTKVASMRRASARPTVLLPAPDGPSTATRTRHRRGAPPASAADLGRPQVTPLALAQAGERQRPDPRANETLDGRADGIEEAAHLPLAALADPDPQPRAGLVAVALDLRRWRRVAERRAARAGPSSSVTPSRSRLSQLASAPA